jgi:RNA polymerase sigma-70 factor (ECF subfamily)
MPRLARQLPSEPAANVRELAVGPTLDDAVLVARAREGDRWAEEALYQRHVPYVMGMVVRLLGSRDEAEDIVQDTFAIGLDRLATLRQADSVRAWFAQIAVSQVRRKLRRARLLSRLGLEPPLDDVDLESLAVEEADAETRAELAAIGRALAKLPTNDRLAWMLRNVDGEPLAEVARLCGCSLATAKRRIAAAARYLEQHIGSAEGRT